MKFKLTRRNITIVAGILTGILMCIEIIYSYFSYKADMSRLHKNHTVVCGTMTQISSNGRSTPISFEYKYNDKLYQFHGVGCPRTVFKNYHEHGLRQMLIAIAPNDPENYKILSEPEDFVEIGITKNDTMGIRCLPLDRDYF